MNKDIRYDRAIVAFSGGLDTSMLVPYMRETYNLKEIITCCVDTGGMKEHEKKAVEARSKELGADVHILVDAAQEFYDEIIKYLIFGNVSRDGYPLSIGSERLIQARETIRIAKERGIKLVAHGSTGAGNDQYRFDLVGHVLGDGAIDFVAPVRAGGLSREFSQNYLRERQFSVPEKSKYSVNAGLWGLSIGGVETLTSKGLIPEDAWMQTLAGNDAKGAKKITLRFEQGEPVALTDGTEEIKNPLDVIRKLIDIGGDMGIGRHYHVGSSIPGRKGRIAYESPAADIIYEAHRTLEKHVLSQAQIFLKQNIANEFGRLIHEAKFFDPLLDDLRAFLTSSQRRVTGKCHITLKPGKIDSVVIDSPYDLHEIEGSVYGESASFYDGRDAEGSTKIHSYEQVLCSRVAGK